MSFSNQEDYRVGEKCIVNDNYCDGKTRCNECQVPTRKILVELYRTAFGTTELSDCSTDTTTNNVVLQLYENKKIVTDPTESELSDCKTTNKEVVE